jgi:hypothetical protein
VNKEQQLPYIYEKNPFCIVADMMIKIMGVLIWRIASLKLKPNTRILTNMVASGRVRNHKTLRRLFHSTQKTDR